MLGGVARTNIGRLINTDPATQSLTSDGSSITWLRGGASPEVWRTTFEASTMVWIGSASARVAHRWRLAVDWAQSARNSQLPRPGLSHRRRIRWLSVFVESIIGTPVLVTQQQPNEQRRHHRDILCLRSRDRAG